MKVLVTGGAGFVGSNIVRMLEAKGAKTIIFDNFYSANYKNILDIKGEVICADVLDKEVFKKLPKLDAVIHEAAITDTTLNDDTKMMMVNYNGFKNIADFCLSRKIKLVYASSAGVYGATNAVMQEEQEPIPHNTYAYSKYLCDCYLGKILKLKSSSLIVGLRYFNVYGPGEYHKGSAASMIYQLYRQMFNNQRPRVFKYGEQKRDFIYVKDVARISIEALQLKKSNIFNVGTATPRSFNDIIKVLNNVLKTNLEPDYFDNPYRDKYQDYTQADITRLRKVMKTTANFSLEQGIKDYVLNYLNPQKLL
ncbi:MAG: ADP-glyceromanno-heptose 6-epimerase [Candidatus Omnitrophica bacterium]|jgi:ADP-L-glycero-D-manno-heptose 6-epimerase|nr:ADP-glyceromanno-heptose 6-epimerase [Candidatus Omnitrophota bacterium]